MAPALPTGDSVARDGALPSQALATLPSRRLGVYVHIPFCRTRCGYCDFNTYTASELGPGASRESYTDTVLLELALAADVLGDRVPPIETIYFGGGTPTLLPAADLVRVVEAIGSTFGLAADAEVTTESNPDSVDPQKLARLRDGGVNRISFGVQSAVPQVLATLDRTHDPERVPDVVRWAREAGFEQVSVDLIYGTPGESDADWRASLRAALDLEPDHISAYGLTVEEGTALARRVARGEVEPPDDDDMAERYAVADAVLADAGYGWYELSNWARRDDARCRHNQLYWTGGNWWGIGPGAHSHVGGTRWWNVKHPAAYAHRLASGTSPAHAREVLGAETQRLERVLLESRLSDGLAVDVLDAAGRRAVRGLVDDGLVEPDAQRRVVLTRRGRLLADTVVHALHP